MTKLTDEQIVRAYDILDKFDFFNQRAGRELWADKPKDIQNKDIENFSRDIEFLKDFINRLKADNERLKQYEIMEDLELINQYTRRPLTQDEVYVFSIVLCDNDMDRAYEKFTVESLNILEKLFVGKTGFIDYNNQTARIFSCKVEPVEGRKNAVGEDYFRLVAKAYMIINDTNKDLILDIDKGNMKKVSVGCAIAKTRCSICGKDINSVECIHHKGEEYNGKICYGELIKPTDAYEWSFTAIPTENKESNDCIELEGKVATIVKQTIDEIIKTVKTEVRDEAYKEFAESLHQFIQSVTSEKWNREVYPNSWTEAYEQFDEDITNILKEKVGEG